MGRRGNAFSELALGLTLALAVVDEPAPGSLSFRPAALDVVGAILLGDIRDSAVSTDFDFQLVVRARLERRVDATSGSSASGSGRLGERAWVLARVACSSSRFAGCDALAVTTSGCPPWPATAGSLFQGSGESKIAREEVILLISKQAFKRSPKQAKSKAKKQKSKKAPPP